MHRAGRQLTLDLPVSPGFGSEDYLVGVSNEQAFAAVDSWPDWPDPLLLLQGPEGSGKSHLAAIWAARADAPVVAAAAIRPERVPELSGAPALAVEDIDRGPVDEPALFHLVNLARERGRSLLVTSGAPLAAFGFRTPDLLSRLRLAPLAVLDRPDDGLLRALLVKLFHDRQITVEASVVDFVALRIERSFAAAGRIVAELDHEALSLGRRVTRPVAAEVLARFGIPETAQDALHPIVTSGT